MFVLKYSNGKFVGEDLASGGYPFETIFPNSRFFLFKSDAQTYLDTLIYQFPNVKFDPVIYKITVSPD